MHDDDDDTEGLLRMLGGGRPFCAYILWMSIRIERLSTTDGLALEMFLAALIVHASFVLICQNVPQIVSNKPGRHQPIVMLALADGLTTLTL